MSFNIMDLVTEQLGSQMSGQIGNLLGDQSAMTAKGLETAVPALLNGFTKRAGVPGGADVLFDAVSKQDDGLLDNIGSMLGGGQGNSVIDTGTSLLSGLFGNSGLGSLAGIVSGISGLSKGNTGSLMGIVAPIIIGIIKRKVMGGGLNAGGMLDMLKGQQNNISAAMPVGLSDQLSSSGFLGSITGAASDAVGGATNAVGNAADGVRNVAGNVAGNVGDAAGNVGNAASNVAGNAAAGGSSMLKKIIPVVGLALLGWLGWNFFGSSAKDAAEEATNAASGAAATATSAASDAAATATSAVTDAMDVDVDGMTGDLTGMFDSAKTSLEGITDAESATAALPQLEEMGEKLGGITGMMEKVPEAARGPLSGIVSTGIATLEPLLETVRGIPGVGAIIDPIITPILESLKGLAG